MKFFRHWTFLLICSAYFLSCEKNVTITKNIIHYDSRVHLSAIADDEKLPAGINHFFINKPTPKFPLSYYLIQEEDIKYFRSQNFDMKIVQQLTFIVSGIKYYKLFVHPDSEALYMPLTSAYRYIGPNDTEFVASPIPGNKTLIVWTKNYLERTPFIVKAAIDNQALEAISSRFPADIQTAPELVSIIFKHKIKGTKDKFQGQQVTQVPLHSQLPQ